MPILSDKIPSPCKNLKAGDLMSKNVVSLKMIEFVENVNRVVTSDNHHNYPVFGPDHKLVGIIPKNFVLTMVQYEGWYGKEEMTGTRSRSSSITGSGSINSFEQWNKKFKERQIEKNKYVTQGDLWHIKSEYQENASMERYNNSYSPTHQSRLLPW